MKSFTLVSGSLIAMLLVSGCAPTLVQPAPIEDIKVGDLPPEPAPYKIGAGDELEIKFLYAPELNETLPVRPDGKVSVSFAGDVQAAGRTPRQLEIAIRNDVAGHVRQPDLVVVVHSFASQKVYVGGEVLRPGSIQLTGPISILQVLNEAGWMTPLAGGEKVELLRRDDAGKQRLYPIDIEKVMTGEDLAQNVMVQAGDVVLVPPSDAVARDRWVDQNIRQTVPFSMGASAAYNMNGRIAP